MIVVPGRPSEDGLTWWVYSETGSEPTLRLDGEGAGTARVTKRNLAPVGAGKSANAYVVATTGLPPDRPYTLTAEGGQNPGAANSRTLPHAPSGQPLTFCIGSCYSIACDDGIAKDYPPHLYRGGDPIRFRILCGDQLYMDLSAERSSLGAGPLITNAPDPWRKYLDQWLDGRFRPMLTATPNLFMADDHEYWNDYPHSNAWLFWDENRPGGPLGTAMDNAFAVFQAPLNLPASLVEDPAADLLALLGDKARTFRVDLGAASLFVLDTRTARTRYDADSPHFTRPSWLSEVRQWLASLGSPGLLVVSQPLIEHPAGWVARLTHTMGDVNLPDYPDDYAALWEAVVACPHEVLILSGDIHWSRLSYVTPASNPQRKFPELISSPVSLLAMSPGSVAKESNGTLKWQGGGLANWLTDFKTNDRQSYATVTITPKGDPGSPVDVEVSWWGLNLNTNSGARLLATRTFTLS